MTTLTVNIECPGCGVILRVTNSKNEAEKRFSCPNCGKHIVIPFYKIKPEDGETQLDGQPGAQATQMGGQNVDQKSCYLLYNGRKYELAIGQNCVGRRAMTSSADVQIDTDDRFFSREHMLINVRRLPDGGIKVDVSNYKNKNATYVNNNLLEQGDAIVLHDGDKILVGASTLTFHTK